MGRIRTGSIALLAPSIALYVRKFLVVAAFHFQFNCWPPSDIGSKSAATRFSASYRSADPWNERSFPKLS